MEARESESNEVLNSTSYVDRRLLDASEVIPAIEVLRRIALPRLGSLGPHHVIEAVETIGSGTETAVVEEAVNVVNEIERLLRKLRSLLKT